MKQRLQAAKRIVVKIGSALLVDAKTGEVKSAWLSTLIDDLAKAKAGGADIIVVSSGAIALGPALAWPSKRQAASGRKPGRRRRRPDRPRPSLVGSIPHKKNRGGPSAGDA